MVRLNRSLIAWIAAVVWMAGLAWASLSPPPPVPTGSDLWLHAAAYGILTLLLRGAVADRGKILRTLAAAAVAFAYGAFVEGAQAALPYRTAEARDLLANATGVALAVLIPIYRRSGATTP